MSGSNSSPPAEKHGLLDEPLGLTVHSLPQPAEAEQDSERRTRTRSGRLKMLLVLAICAAPVIASYLTYYVFRPQSRHSYGELIEPQRPMPSIEITGADGRKLPLSELQGQWLLASVAGGACKQRCEDHLYLQRQLRESLGREKDRVDWVWFVNDAEPVRESLRPGLEKSQATLVRVDPKALGAWLAPGAGHALEDHIYLIDPLGHWMMRFPAGMGVAEAGKAKRDLERLLRAANSWDLPGRDRR